MRDEKKKGINWGSAISGLIFLLVVAGGPIVNLLRQTLGSSVSLPSNLLPWLIAGLVLLSIVVSAVRSVGRGGQRRSDTRLPTSMPPAPGVPPPASPAPISTGPAAAPPGAATPSLSTPRFDPIISPRVLLFGVLGLLLIAGAALLLGVL